MKKKKHLIANFLLFFKNTQNKRKPNNPKTLTKYAR